MLVGGGGCWWWDGEELGWVVLGGRRDVCVMGICVESRNV